MKNWASDGTDGLLKDQLIQTGTNLNNFVTAVKAAADTIPNNGVVTVRVGEKVTCLVGAEILEATLVKITWNNSSPLPGTFASWKFEAHWDQDKSCGFFFIFFFN